ncbi:30S ribosomal protein S1 [Chlamydia abortus]|uniref:30S ribosomal protein S1 n=1 Tax=Chlamydia abortus (strain DSM 27085 / S26/3) TaxID=218497 RepID=Q5L625_CHLAB|nr:30S ribosomal protein S1 [Chlamydia abortus]ASD30618.1 30S ribosomal protein S1 [Chlamydia abortus]AUS59918.1 30S ribosomal protein S1 [Chlamydia abortus]QEM73819.1 30S ribosomal protein S1 [Chlamydia abortus]QRR32142.1 30S ribosomal protein S1 [Chlamydia abortus]CAH63906.1 30s ribosomal protein S1 [Chlamydia abortus S26/3]
MPKQSEYTWGSKKILDTIDCLSEDVVEFKDLLCSTHGITSSDEEPTSEIQPGAILKGTVVDINKDFVVVDVGLKSEGVIPMSEFIESSEGLVLGAEVEVYLDQTEDEEGKVVLSREKATRQRQWEHILAHCEEGSIVKGQIIRKVKGGLIVDIGMEAFLPGSQIDNKKIKNLDDYVGKVCEFKILKINIDRRNVVVSRRELLEAERISKKAELIEQITIGERRKGIVKNITDFGVFLDLDGIDGLLHITDMTWKRIRHPSEMVELNQELEVVILSVDKEKGRVALGLKQKEHNPWEDIEKKYPPGKRITGKIVKLLPYGAFIEIEEGIEGLIHVSEMSWVKNVVDPSEVVNKGDEVEAIVLSIQKDEGKISLGLKQTEHNPWDNIEEKYPIGLHVRAEIKNLTNYGAFVELEPGIEGLIHISDMSWIKKVSHPSELFKKGSIVEAVILSVDKESKKITLGVKQLSSNPWNEIEEMFPTGSVISGVVTKITAFGAFVELQNGIEGLIHVSELSEKPFSKIEDIISIGDSVSAKVIKLDPDHKKVSLSVKEYLADKQHDQTDTDIDDLDLEDLVSSDKKKKGK